MIVKLLGFVNLPIQLGPSSGCSRATVTVAWHLPFVTLCLSAMAEGCSDARVASGMIEKEALNVG